MGVYTNIPVDGANVKEENGRDSSVAAGTVTELAAGRDYFLMPVFPTGTFEPFFFRMNGFSTGGR